MFRDFANIKKLILLGFAVASTKVMLVLFAYFFDAPTYNQFNQIYYTSSIIILFGSLGFGLAVTRINITLKLILAAVTINSIVTYFILQLISAPFTDPFEISSLMIYSICNPK